MRHADRRRALLLTAFAAWAVAVPWVARALGLPLDVATRLEVIDHVVPGLVVLAVCAWLLLRGAGAAPDSMALIVATGVAVLAGGWIVATHAGLVPDVLHGAAGWGAALLHLSAGPPIVVVSLWMLLADAGP